MIVQQLPIKDKIGLEIGDGKTTPKRSTSGKTVEAFLTSHRNGTQTSVKVGSVAGAAAKTKLTVNLDLASTGIVPGLYELEAIADAGGTNPITLLPNETVGVPLIVNLFLLKKLV